LPRRCQRRGNQTTNDDIVVGHATKHLTISTIPMTPVRSGFLRPKRATVDRNRSRTDPDIAGTEPDHLGPVFCGPRNQKRLVQTGFLV
ncbi:hypothetical protein K443DRAFT_89772, partial [Laccaria amethystina LaAM-08-1]